MSGAALAGAIVLLLGVLVLGWVWLTIKLWIRGVKLVFKLISLSVLLLGLAALAAAVGWAVLQLS